jgi:cytidylate kinase
MAIFYLVRHGEADYSEMLEKGFYGFGRSFAPLSKAVDAVSLDTSDLTIEEVVNAILKIINEKVGEIHE